MNELVWLTPEGELIVTSDLIVYPRSNEAASFAMAVAEFMAAQLECLGWL